MRFKNSYNRCELYRKLFSEYLDGELQSVDRAAVHSHLAECAKCSAEIGKLSRTVAMLGEFGEETMPAGFSSYRLPRFTFIEIFPSFQQQENREPISGVLAPYASALFIFVLVLSMWVGMDHRYNNVHPYAYNSSNYIEVVAEL